MAAPCERSRHRHAARTEPRAPASANLDAVLPPPQLTAHTHASPCMFARTQRATGRTPETLDVDGPVCARGGKDGMAAGGRERTWPGASDQPPALHDCWCDGMGLAGGTRGPPCHPALPAATCYASTVCRCTRRGRLESDLRGRLESELWPNPCTRTSPSPGRVRGRTLWCVRGGEEG